MHETEREMSVGTKLLFFGGFTAIWLVLCFMFQSSSAFFREGGWGMWPILAVGLLFILITIDRTRYLFVRIHAVQRSFFARVQRHVLQGDVTGAVEVCSRTNGPLASMVGAGLSQLHRPDDEVQDAVDEAALYEMPRIERRTGYLAMLGNIATLLGLLGTIVGLITSFAGVSLENERDPDTQRRAGAYVYLVPQCNNLSGPGLVACIKQNKAAILARGISEAMHCTAFGLAVGILSLLAFSVFNGRTQHLIDDITDATVKLVNLAVAHRQSIGLGQGAAEPDTSLSTV